MNDSASEIVSHGYPAVETETGKKRELFIFEQLPLTPYGAPIVRLLEIPFQQALEGFAVPGFVPCHFIRA